MKSEMFLQGFGYRPSVLVITLGIRIFSKNIGKIAESSQHSRLDIPGIRSEDLNQLDQSSAPKSFINP